MTLRYIKHLGLMLISMAALAAIQPYSVVRWDEPPTDGNTASLGKRLSGYHIDYRTLFTSRLQFPLFQATNIALINPKEGTFLSVSAIEAVPLASLVNDRTLSSIVPDSRGMEVLVIGSNVIRRVYWPPIETNGAESNWWINLGDVVIFQKIIE